MTEPFQSGRRGCENSDGKQADEKTPSSDRLSKATDEIVRATGLAFYYWDIASDEIEWSRNFGSLVGLGEDETRHLNGRQFESMLGSDSQGTRFGVVVSKGMENASDEPVPYQCVYVLHPSRDESLEPLWIEDTGCWFPGENGKPVRAEGSIRIINERRKREEDLRRRTDFDDLTGLPNRRYMEKRIDHAILKSTQSGVVSTFLFVSIDRMNLINDIYGFETGDDVLRHIGSVLLGNLRADDVVCRFSGAKFGLILNDCPPAEIYDAANRLLDAISEDVIKTAKGYVSVTARAGTCFLPTHAENSEQGIHAAFIATKNSHHEPSRRVSVYTADPEVAAQTRKKSEFSVSVIEAIQENRFQLAYQPVCRADGTVAFHEALARLVDRDGKISIAADFISMVEELGLVRIVDKYTLKLVLKVLNDYPDARLSINVSQDTVMDPSWLSDLATGLTGIENGGDRLIVEITESLAVTELAETEKFLRNVQALGCKVAIDDFGAGFTSFSNLKHLPVDMIKIDGAFALNLAQNSENQVFVKALLELSKAFDIETVVEWVEDTATSDILSGLQVDYQQGHKFGRPTTPPPWEMADRLDRDLDESGADCKVA